MIDPKSLPRPVFDEYDSPEHARAQARRKLAAAFRIFAKLGFEQGVMGHVSVRDPIEPDTLWMNSFAQSFNSITTDDLLRVDFQANIVEGEGFVHPGGIATHVAIYQANDNLRSVAHAHAVHSIAWSSLDRLFDPISAESAALYGKHAIYDTYKHGEGHKLAEFVKDNRVVIFKSHGIFTVGETLEEAVYLFILTEKVSQVHLLVEASGLTPERIDEDVARRISASNDSIKSTLNFQPYFQAALKEFPDLDPGHA